MLYSFSKGPGKCKQINAQSTFIYCTITQNSQVLQVEYERRYKLNICKY